jgi:hypothetical protein
MQINAAGALRGQFVHMDGLGRIFSAFRALYRALPIVLGIVIILTSAVPALSRDVEHCENNDARVIAMADHAVPANNEGQDHRANPICHSAGGCFAVFVPANEVSTRIPRAATIDIANSALLVTRNVAPPLPPPKIIILV